MSPSPFSRSNPPRTDRSRLWVALAGAVVLTGLSACKPDNTFAPPPPPEVEVRKPLIEETTVYLEWPGSTQAFARVEIRARVRGFLKSREYQPGEFVEADALLFTIEPEEFQAAVEAAQGNLDAAVAARDLAKAEYDRRKQAFENNRAVSEIDVLSAKANLDAAEAQIKISQATLNDAKRDLSYTDINTPTAGRVSVNLVDPGNLVGVSEPTLLTSVVLDDPMYVNFEVNEREVLPYLYRRPTTVGEVLEKKGNSRSVRLQLSDGSTYPEGGTFEFIDNAVDRETGTIRARAVFPNPEANLADGLFVRIQFPETLPDANKVPRSAIQRDLGGDYVLVVGESNKVERRVVKPTQFFDGDYRIIDAWDEEARTGLKPEDRIVVSNLQRARAGVEVKPIEAGSAQAEAPPSPPEDTDTPEGGAESGADAGADEKPAADEQN